MRRHAAIGDHIDLDAQELLELIAEVDEIEEAAARLHLDKQVDISRAGVDPVRR